MKRNICYANNQKDFRLTSKLNMISPRRKEIHLPECIPDGILGGGVILYIQSPRLRAMNVIKYKIIPASY